MQPYTTAPLDSAAQPDSAVRLDTTKQPDITDLPVLEMIVADEPSINVQPNGGGEMNQSEAAATNEVPVGVEAGEVAVPVNNDFQVH